MKFTKEIKAKWLEALKSGKYKQGFSELHTKTDNSYCCLGVLAKITPGLSCEYKLSNPTGSPYKFLNDNLSGRRTENLYRTNDRDKDNPSYPRDYSNVIPLIEALPTVD